MSTRGGAHRTPGAKAAVGSVPGVTDGIYVGNADPDALADHGWLLGHFKPEGDPRHSTDVEI